MFNTLSTTTGTEPALVEISGCRFTPNRQDIETVQPIYHTVVQAVLLLVLLVHKALIIMDPGTLLLLVRSLLDYDMRWFKITGQVSHDRATRYETVVIHADHRLEVLNLIWREHIESGSTDERSDR